MAAIPVEPPETYAQWAELLEMLKDCADDEPVIRAMEKGTIIWQTGVTERFSNRLIDAVSSRMNRAVDSFRKAIDRSYGQERLFIQALNALKKEFSFLVRVVSIPALPENDRERYRRQVMGYAEQIQRSLENSSKTDRTGRLTTIIKNHNLLVFNQTGDDI